MTSPNLILWKIVVFAAIIAVLRNFYAAVNITAHPETATSPISTIPILSIDAAASNTTIQDKPLYVVNSSLHWSDFPRTTQFTPHVLKIVKNLNQTMVARCSFQLEFIAHRGGHSNVTCSGGEKMWCTWFARTLSTRPSIPYNVTIGLTLSDSFRPKDDTLEGCLGNSSPKGRFCIINSEDTSEHNKVAKRPDSPQKWPYSADVPWEERSPIPVFRGSPRGYEFYSFCKSNPNISYADLLAKVKGRYAAVDLSVDHPELLNARFYGFTGKGCFAFEATNGLSKLLPADRIEQDLYYSNHQVALVLGGAGAAYRTARHLMTRTAIVLQTFKYEEWFTPYMRPWVHYIPLAEDMSDLKQQLEWIQQRPTEVKEIAEAGFEFYQEFLTFAHNEEHMYELVYRLSEYFHQQK